MGRGEVTLFACTVPALCAFCPCKCLQNWNERSEKTNSDSSQKFWGDKGLFRCHDMMPITKPTRVTHSLSIGLNFACDLIKTDLKATSLLCFNNFICLFLIRQHVHLALKETKGWSSLCYRQTWGYEVAMNQIRVPALTCVYLLEISNNPYVLNVRHVLKCFIWLKPDWLGKGFWSWPLLWKEKERKQRSVLDNHI